MFYLTIEHFLLWKKYFRGKKMNDEILNVLGLSEKEFNEGKKVDIDIK